MVIEKFKWYKELITMNKQLILENNVDLDLEDLMLVPHLIEKIILLKLIKLAENVYDPMSSTQTKYFSILISKLIDDYPTINNKSSNTKVK
jgi:hypothetical protein